jgi:hypothetical protein
VHSIAPELNAALDAVTDVIRKLKVLTDLNLGVSTETAVFERRIEGGAGDSSMLTYRLAFGRVGRKYQIYIREDLVYQDEPGDEFDVWLRSEQLPWSSFPRDLRLLAFQALPAFLQCIANTFGSGRVFSAGRPGSAGRAGLSRQPAAAKERRFHARPSPKRVLRCVGPKPPRIKRLRCRRASASCAQRK